MEMNAVQRICAQKGTWGGGFLRLCVLFIIATVVAGCKIQIDVPEGAKVVSRSGDFVCNSGKRCVISVTDGTFEESFYVETEPGYVFEKWLKQKGSFCGGKTGDCQLTSKVVADNPDLAPILESETVFYVEPVVSASENDLLITKTSLHSEDDNVISKPIVLTFNKRVNAQVAQGAVELLDNYGRPWPVEVRVAGEEVRIIPQQALRFDTRYTLKVSSVSASQGDAKSRAFRRVFTTQSRNTGFILGAHTTDGVLTAFYGGWEKPSYIIDTLAANGMRNLRLGQTTQTSSQLENTHPLNWDTLGDVGENWSSRAQAAYSLELLGDRNGGGNSIFFFLSSTSTHIYKYQTDNGWEDLSDKQLLVEIEKHARESAKFYADKGLLVHQFEIGNETDVGIAGFYMSEGGRVPEGPLWSDLEWAKENLWVHHIDVVNAAARGVREYYPDARIVIHNVGYFQSEGYTEAFYQYMVDAGVDFDVIGLSYPYLSSAGLESEYDSKPFFKGAKFHDLLLKLSALGKDIQLSEFNYHHGDQGVEIEPAADYPTTPKGHAKFITDMVDEWASYSKVTAVYYFYPDYYEGMCDCFHDASGLWQTPLKPHPAMDAFRQLDIKYNGVP
jgi:Glycosyl hydrolase family 53/Bacterial Ig-like domain